MSNIIPGIPPAAQELLEAMSSCTEEIIWKNGTYLLPLGKIVFQGMITPGDTRPGGGKWIGDKPMYLIVYNHPYNEPGMCDSEAVASHRASAHWFEVDTMTVTSQVLPEVLPPAQNALEVLEVE